LLVALFIKKPPHGKDKEDYFLLIGEFCTIRSGYWSYKEVLFEKSEQNQTRHDGCVHLAGIGEL
jgi:hypothetical protein